MVTSASPAATSHGLTFHLRVFLRLRAPFFPFCGVNFFVTTYNKIVLWLN